MILTKEILIQGRSCNGGWSKSQVALFGVHWPLQSGWMDAIIGEDFPYKNIKSFVQLKDAHIIAKREREKKQKIEERAKERQTQKRYTRVWLSSRHNLSVDEAAQRLNDDKVWARASKGFRD